MNDQGSRIPLTPEVRDAIQDLTIIINAAADALDAGADPARVADDLRRAVQPAYLSRLLWDARERLEMYADHLNARGAPDRNVRRIVAEIDAYRARQGWSSDGFSGES